MMENYCAAAILVAALVFAQSRGGSSLSGKRKKPCLERISSSEDEVAVLGSDKALDG